MFPIYNGLKRDVLSLCFSTLLHNTPLGGSMKAMKEEN
jgi:hypothetical protein